MLNTIFTHVQNYIMRVISALSQISCRAEHLRVFLETKQVCCLFHVERIRLRPFDGYLQQMVQWHVSKSVSVFVFTHDMVEIPISTTALETEIYHHDR